MVAFCLENIQSTPGAQGAGCSVGGGCVLSPGLALDDELMFMLDPEVSLVYSVSDVGVVSEGEGTFVEPVDSMIVE